ncbi:MAG: PH domain-containing protein [Phycisphaerales bacterium]
MSSTVVEQEIFVAKFNPLIRPYLVLSIGATMVMSIIGIPIALIWFLGVGQWWARHYFHKLECHVTNRRLRYRKGILFQVEKTIPLENIQDVTFIEGPVLRHFHLSTVKFETAGHSAGQANDMHLTGIIDAHEFRNRILEAREQLLRGQRGAGAGLPGAGAVLSAPAGAPGGADAEQLALLRQMAQRLDEIARTLREPRP